MGEHTRMIRRAFHQAQTKQKRKYHGMLLLLLLVAAGVGAYAFYQHRHIRQQTSTAKDIFYAMKALDVDMANVEKLVLETQNRTGLEQVKQYQSRRRQMERSYDRFLSALRVYDPKMTEEQRLVLARGAHFR